MKTLETERLILRAWTPEDAPAMFEYARSCVVGPMAGWKPHESLAESRGIIANFIAEDETWAICDKSIGKPVGSVGLHADRLRSLDKSEARMLGYVLAEDHWGKGLMTEACREVMRFAFEEMDIAILSVYHFPFNFRSKNVILKLGFRPEGVLRHATRVFDGTVFDFVLYSMTIDEYFALNGSTNK